MPILHYKLTSNNATINLPSEIHSQSFLLRRTMVQQVPLQDNFNIPETNVVIRGPEAVSSAGPTNIQFASGSLPNVLVGMTIIGPNVPNNTTVTGVADNGIIQEIIISANSAPIVFTPNQYQFQAVSLNYMILSGNGKGLKAGMPVAGLNIPASTTITTVDTSIIYQGVTGTEQTTRVILSQNTSGVLSNIVDAYSFLLQNPQSINGGGVVCQPSHLSGLEIISGNGSNSNDILIAYNELISTHNIFYDMEFESESVPRGFQVKTFKFNYNLGLKVQGFEPLATFVDQPTALNPNPTRIPGEIISIDLFFQFSSLYNYESY